MASELTLEEKHAIQEKDWLAVPWDFRIMQTTLEFGTRFDVHVGDLDVARCHSLELAEKWMQKHQRRTCLAELIAGMRNVHPAIAVIKSGGSRLGRIPPDLWGSYDALRLDIMMNSMCILSAKACALFPDHADVRIEVTTDQNARISGGRERARPNQADID